MTKVFGFKFEDYHDVVLLLIAAIYTSTVMLEWMPVSKLATICTYLFFALLGYFLFFGWRNSLYLETGFERSLGKPFIQNFIGMSA